MVDCHITAQYVHAVSELLSLKLYEYLLYRTCNRKMPRFPTVVCCVHSSYDFSFTYSLCITNFVHFLPAGFHSVLTSFHLDFYNMLLAPPPL